MAQATLKILDSIHTKANAAARKLILPCLEYEDVKWVRGRFGGQNKSTDRYLITGRKNTGGTFLTGLIPRVEKYAKSVPFFCAIDKSGLEHIKPTRIRPALKGITFRPDQLKALRSIRRLQRGIIKFPTGSGKTIIALGAFSMFENSPRLFLCHTKDLLTQTIKEIEMMHKRPKVFALGSGYRPPMKLIKKTSNPIVVSTIQTFSKYNPSEWCDFFDFTIVDECHKATSKTSQYGRMMEFNLAPIRLGLSATPPKSGKKQLVCEGFFGPIIGELTMSKGIRKGIIAKPEVNLIPVPYNVNIANHSSSYKKMYDNGIVFNEERNNLIVQEVMKTVKKKQIILVVIENTRHGETLRSMLKLKGKHIPFVHGGTKKEEREKVKNNLKSGKIKAAICSRIWREGINIPSLNNIVNAHGMKAETIILQVMGRGLRTTETKKNIRLTDFLDPYRYLAEHTVQRITIYKEQKWI
jgi:superfamily II DNA or RNA helicase